MKKWSPATYLFGVGALVVAGFITFAILMKSAPSPYDAFAQCLTEQGVKMYGAYWCPHCQNQKKMFGNAFRYIIYEECATPGAPQVMTESCTNAGVEGYPTWKNAAGEIIAGEQTFEDLAAFSTCHYEPVEE